MNKKGVSVILSYAILFAIVITATALAFRWGQTELNELQGVKNLNSAETVFLNIDSLIKDVNRGGEGSSRNLRVNFDKGEYFARSYHISISSNATVFETDLKTLSMSLEVKSDVLDANMTRDGDILKSYFNNIFEISESYMDIVAETQNDDVYTVINFVDITNIVLSGKKEIYIKNEGIEDLNFDTDPPYTLIMGNETYTIRTENKFLIVEREGSKIYTKFLGEGAKTYHLNIRITTLTIKIS
ncbi:MAG: hypothetical protein KAV48_03085 [Methanomicrobia archaeon]|nr:hypothetical protein [Methanomicrobia archaeon]